MLDDLKQVLGNEETPQSGVYTVDYLCERLLSEGDSKQWLSWLYFCTKWEKAAFGSTSIFLAFPDFARYEYIIYFGSYLVVQSFFIGEASCLSPKCSSQAACSRSSS